VLWSDSKVFAGHSESGGNALMYALSEKALQLMKGNSFANPIDLLDDLYWVVMSYLPKPVLSKARFTLYPQLMI